MTQFQTLAVQVQDGVAYVKLNRPDKANALNQTMWEELPKAMQWCDENEEVRVVLLSGEGKHFCSGIDVTMLMGIQQTVAEKCETRKREKLRKIIVELQASVSSLEKCSKPVIAAIHGACVGGGLDIVLAADIRYAAADAFFSVKEVDMGMVADVGTLQRLHTIVGQGKAREWALTGKNILVEEAQKTGLVNDVQPTAEQAYQAAEASAKLIAEKSPVAVRGTKHILNYSRDHGVDEGLNYMATWNAAMLMSEDIQKAVMAFVTKNKPTFRN